MEGKLYVNAFALSRKNFLPRNCAFLRCPKKHCNSFVKKAHILLRNANVLLVSVNVLRDNAKFLGNLFNSGSYCSYK